jgi:hypothetical protein
MVIGLPALDLNQVRVRAPMHKIWPKHENGSLSALSQQKILSALTYVKKRDMKRCFSAHPQGVGGYDRNLPAAGCNPAFSCPLA